MTSATGSPSLRVTVSSSTGSSSSSVGSNAADPTISVGGDESPLLAGNETCAFANAPPAYGFNCREPRSCRSCLQKTGCMISPAGNCMQLQELTVWNFKNAFPKDVVLPNATATNSQALGAPQYWQFPAHQATYCPANDSICQRCIEYSFWASGILPDSRFCVGTNGCVCVYACEARFRYSPSYVECYSDSNPYDPAVNPAPEKTISVSSDVSIVCLCMGGFLLLVGINMFRLWRKEVTHLRNLDETRRAEREARAARREQERQRRAGGVNALSLTGWKAFRADLIDKENQQFSANSSQENITTASYVTLQDGDAEQLSGQAPPP